MYMETPSPKEEYEAKKATKEEQRNAKGKEQRKPHTTRSAVRVGVALIILGLIGYGIYSSIKEKLPQGEDVSVAYEEIGRGHIALDAEFTYNSNPPTSGDHYVRPATPGFYDVTDLSIPDKVLVHNLEHGDVWIAYKPTISADVKDIIEKFAAAKVIVTPREENETDLAIVAWARLDAFDISDNVDIAVRIQDFITRHSNRAPERIPAGAGIHSNTYNPETGI